MRSKKSWLARFSAAARWYLPQAEVEDVIGDYRELLAEDTRTEEELARDLGEPRAAAKLLVQPRAYWVWLGTFILLALCLALPGLSPLPGMDPRFWGNLFGWLSLSQPLALLGAVGAIVWFRWKGHKAKKLPKAIPVFLAVLTGWFAVVMATNWTWMHDPEGFSKMWGQIPLYILWVRIGPETYTVSRSLCILTDALMWIGGLGMVLVGLYALVKARTEDRRWTAVYILAMTVMMVSLTSLALLLGMNLDGPDWWVPTFRWCLCYAAVGLIGAGVSLC